MLGVILGDVFGSAHQRTKTQDLELITPNSHWTENTIFTLATADYLLFGGDYEESYTRWYSWYPQVKGGYNNSFSEWAKTSGLKPYYSCRSDGALRAAPIAYAFDNLKEVMEEAERSALVSHNHPDGIKGAQATAAAIFLAKEKAPKDTISDLLTSIFSYNFKVSYQDLQQGYQYSSLATDTVEAAIIAFLHSKDFEDAVRKAIALGGDAKTLAAIAGGIAEAFYPKVPKSLQNSVWPLLDEGQQDLISEFQAEFVTELVSMQAA